MSNDKEKILCAAVWYKDLPLIKTFDSNVLPVNCDRGLVFCGHRHAQCIYSMCSITGKRSVEPEVGEYVQGFLTSKNRFVDRTEARIIAVREHQLKLPEELGTYSTKELYSEDLY